MPVKIKNAVTPTFSQEEAKDLVAMLENHRSVLYSVGDRERAERCEALKAKIVRASGKVPG